MNKNIFDFKGRTAIVTGGGQGFGLDVAKRFLEGGAKVIIWDIDQKLLDEAVELLDNEKLTSFIVDVSNYKDVENTVNDIISKNNIDILINNAGITGPTGPLWEAAPPSPSGDGRPAPSATSARGFQGDFPLSARVLP